MGVIGMVLLSETMCSFAPSLAPCSPHLPRPASSMCPSCVSACPAVVFFVCGSVFALLAALARPACALCSCSCYPDPAALRPLSRPSPLRFSCSLSTLPARLPSLSVQRCHSCVPLACSTPAPPPRPYPFPWVLPQSPPLTPSWLPGALCVGGGVGVSVVWTVALYPPCAGDACQIPAAAFALWSPATKAWRGQPL